MPAPTSYLPSTLLLLIPPSEGKAAGGTGRFRPASGAFGRRVGHSRESVIAVYAAAVAGADEAEAARLLGVRGELLVRAVEAAAALAAGRAKTTPAWQRFTGVVWEHLDAASLDDEARRQIVVPSGLLGLIVAADPVPDHRLKLSVSLPGVGRLDRFWKPQLTEALRVVAKRRTIVDLLPAEHAAAIDWARLAAKRDVIRASFVSGDGAAVGHSAKAAKGSLARHLLDTGDPASAAGWRWENWRADYDDEARTITVSDRR